MPLPIIILVAAASLIVVFYLATFNNKNIIVRASRKSIFIWVVSAIIGGLFFLIIDIVTSSPITETLSDILTSYLIMLIFSFAFSFPAPIALFLFFLYSISPGNKPWRRTILLLATCYGVTILVLGYFFRDELFNDGFSLWPTNRDFTGIIISYLLANTFAVLLSEKPWRRLAVSNEQ